MSLASRFAGISISDPQKQWDNDFRRQREDAKWNYEQKSLARADAHGELEAAKEHQQESIFDSVRSDFDNGVDTPGTMAYQYTKNMAEIKTLVAGGNLDEANDRVQALKESADRDNAAYRSFASVRPNNAFEIAVSTGGVMMSQYQFWNEQVTLDDQTGTTLGALFLDGNNYKKYRTNSLIRNNFDSEFANSYREADDFKKRIYDMVADPVVNLNRTKITQGNKEIGVGPSYKDASTNPYECRAIGSYLAREWDSMLRELGENGVRTLMDNVMQNHVADGTGIARIKNVRDWVYAQRQGANGESLDGGELVYSSLKEFDRLYNRAKGVADAQAKAINVPVTPDKLDRLVTKTMSAVLQGQRKGSNNVDFSDPVVRDRMDKLVDVFSKYDSLDIPLMVDGHEGGVDMSGALSDYVTSNVESNFIQRADGLYNMTRSMLSGGFTVPQGSKVPTSGNSSVDGIVDGLHAEFAKVCVPKLAGGLREDFSVADVLDDNESRADLLGRWTDRIMAAGALSRETSQYIAGQVMESMTEGEGQRPVNVKDVISRAAFTLPKDDPRCAELLRWYKGTEMVDSILTPYKSQYIRLLSDPVLGPGNIRKNTDIAGMWTGVLKNAATLMEQGIDPTNPMKILASTAAQFYVPTGSWILPGTDIKKSDEEYHQQLKEAKGGKSPKEGYNVADLRPEIVIVPKVNLQTAGSNGIPTMGIPGFAPGEWNTPSGQDRIYAQQHMLANIFLSNNEVADQLLVKHAEKTGDEE